MIEVNGNRLYQFFNMMKKVCPEFLLNIDSTGMWYCTVDHSNVCLQECHIEKDNCLQFSEEDKQVGIYLERVLPFITEHKKDISISLEFVLDNAEEGTYKLTLTSNGSSTEVMCPSPKVIRRQPYIPSFSAEPYTTFVMSVKDMKQVMKTICATGTTRHSDAIKFTVEDGILTVENTDRNITSKMKANCYPTAGRWSCLFNYYYIRNYLSTVDAKEILHIDLRTDYPIFIRTEKMDANVFLLAPRLKA